MIFRVVAGGALLLAACTRPDKEPLLASSATQPPYALRYASELQARARAIGDTADEVHRIDAGLDAHLDEIKKPEWALMRAVVDDSDAAGKSADFADAHGEVDAVRAFWQGEKAALGAKVAGSAQYALKQAPCASDCTNLDVGGPAAGALGESIDKALQKRLRDRNDAFVLIERARASLGTQNAAALERLADDLSQASYLVHAVMPLERQRLERILVDKSGVQTTLDRFVQDERAYQAQPGRSEAEKKASEQRLQAAMRSKTDIDGAAVQADAAIKGGDQTIAATTKEYDDAIKRLRDQIDQKRVNPRASGASGRRRVGSLGIGQASAPH